MAENLAVLDRVNEVLAAYEASFAPAGALALDDDLMAEVTTLVDEAWEQGTEILPTAVDEHDLAISGLTVGMLPPTARLTGMPRSAVIGQRSLR